MSVEGDTDDEKVKSLVRACGRCWRQGWPSGLSVQRSPLDYVPLRHGRGRETVALSYASLRRELVHKTVSCIRVANSPSRTRSRCGSSACQAPSSDDG